MMKLDWDDSFSSGVEEIDNQHKEFIGLVNRLQFMHAKGSQESLTRRVVLELTRYVDYHFTSEENLMMVTRCPLLEQQRREHVKLLETLYEKISAYEQDR